MGKIIFLVKVRALLNGRKITTNNKVATLKRNKPMVKGVADVNFIHTGTPAIRISEIAASKPIVIFLLL